MAYSLSSIPATHREFADMACRSVWEGSVKGMANGRIEPEYIYADGTLSPNGEKYVAQRCACSWLMHFDFSEGVVHRISVELPEECARWGH